VSLEQRHGVTGGADTSVTPPAGTEFVAGAVFVAIAIIAAWSLLTDPYLELGKVGDDPGPAFIPWLGTWIIGIGELCRWPGLYAGQARGECGGGEFVLRSSGSGLLGFS